MFTVLMVAEKPSIAKSVAEILGGNGNVNTRKGSQPVHEFTGKFNVKNVSNAFFKVTSVNGHVFSLDFEHGYSNWDTTDPVSLFSAETRKEETGKKGIVGHLRKEAKGADEVVLWLDCDREGENICFEVLHVISSVMRGKGDAHVHRAKFSAITRPELSKAMDSLCKPDVNLSLAVDARQELDLKVGVAFTRYQTRYFQGKYGNLDSALISYGPCQTPTLGFCVERHDLITEFVPEEFWSLEPTITVGGRQFKLHWERGRVFDQDIANLILKRCKRCKIATLIGSSKKEGKLRRPLPLNTVELLKVCSKNLGMSPHATMNVAERLYISGYISYPRTETTSYPNGFPLDRLLDQMKTCPIGGDHAKRLSVDPSLRAKPRQGVDAGDHPPITPTGSPPLLHSLSSDEIRVYEFVSQRFLATVTKDAKYVQITARFSIGSEQFRHSSRMLLEDGWLSALGKGGQDVSHLDRDREQDDEEEEGEGEWGSFSGVDWSTLKEAPILSILHHEGRTSPPDYLTESELISCMEKNGIGTDASIPVHIKNICERNYVKVEGRRRTLVPTHLGIALVHGYHRIDSEMVLPTVRSQVEKYLDLVATGKAGKQEVIDHSLGIFHNKFVYFMNNVNRMDELFEATFTPIQQMTGSKLKTKCGKCRRYMNFIPLKPTRLYCRTCEETYSLPQGGSVKLYKEITCPLDGFELVLFSFGSGQKSYPLCPFCYNSPILEGVAEHTACISCPHPKCPHSLTQLGICGCPECNEGCLVLDANSSPNWKIDCNLCKYQIKLGPSLHRVTRTSCVCPACGTHLLDLEFSKTNSPLEDGETSYPSACIRCDEFVASRIEGRFSSTFFRRGRGGRGRGRGRGRKRGGRRGRGRSPGY